MNTSITATDRGWFKASFSNQSTNCVEVRFTTDSVLIRDSKQNEAHADALDQQPTIAHRAVHWPAFLDLALSMRSGRVDALNADLHQDGSADLTGMDRNNEPVRLQYTTKEWDAFIKGVADGEFTLR